MGWFRNILARITNPGKYVYGARRSFSFFGRNQVDEDTTMQVSAFNRGLIYISSQIAKLPWDIKDTNNNVITGAVSNLLNLAPNDEMNAFSFRLMMVQQAIIHGNSYAEIERNGIGAPIAIWPLVSDRMNLMRTDSGQLVYRYVNPSSGTVFINPQDIFHLKNFHTKDGLVGQGVVSYGKEVLGIQIAADEMAGGMFRNSGIPSGVISHPGTMSDEAYARLKASWEEQQSGRKSGSTSILEEGVTYTALNIKPDQLQFLESRQFGILEIARFLGVPPTKLFDVTAATFSNVENANLEVATDTLHSWAVNLEMEADTKILNYRYGGRYTEIDLYYIFRGDMVTRSNYFKSMIGIGAITPNQIRGLEGMAPYKQGDSYYISTNNLTPVDRVDEVIDADIEQKTKPATAPQQQTLQPQKDGNKQLEDAAVKFLTERSGR